VGGAIVNSGVVEERMAIPTATMPASPRAARIATPARPSACIQRQLWDDGDVPAVRERPRPVVRSQTERGGGLDASPGPRRAVTIHGEGTQTRDFVFVDDLAAAVVGVMSSPEADVAGATFSVRSGRETAILELADVLDRIVGRAIPRRRQLLRVGDGVGTRSVVSHAPPPTASRLYQATTLKVVGLCNTLDWYQQAAASPTLSPLLRLAVVSSDD
jgi:NAD dependent epimerase/dehydratase family